MDFSRLEGGIRRCSNPQSGSHSFVPAGRLMGRFQATNMADFTLHLTSLFKGTLENSGLEFRVVVDRTNEGTVYLDHDQWEKIVLVYSLANYYD